MSMLCIAFLFSCLVCVSTFGDNSVHCSDVTRKADCFSETYAWTCAWCQYPGTNTSSFGACVHADACSQTFPNTNWAGANCTFAKKICVDNNTKVAAVIVIAVAVGIVCLWFGMLFFLRAVDLKRNWVFTLAFIFCYLVLLIIKTALGRSLRDTVSMLTTLVLLLTKVGVLVSTELNAFMAQASTAAATVVLTMNVWAVADTRHQELALALASTLAVLVVVAMGWKSLSGLLDPLESAFEKPGFFQWSIRIWILVCAFMNVCATVMTIVCSAAADKGSGSWRVPAQTAHSFGTVFALLIVMVDVVLLSVSIAMSGTTLTSSLTRNQK